MGVMVLLIIASVTFAGCFLAAFWWAVSSGQFDDRHTPAMRILLDETNKKSNKSNSAESLSQKDGSVHEVK